MALLHLPISLSLLLVLSIPGHVSGKRVLLLPFPFTSHINQLVAIGNGLVDEGHEVYLSLTESYPDRKRYENGKVTMFSYAMFTN